MQNGLASVDAKTLETLDIWQDDALQIVDMKSVQLSPAYHLMTTLDDMGMLSSTALACNSSWNVVNNGNTEFPKVAI